MPPLQSQAFSGDPLLQRIADDEDRISTTRNRTEPGVQKIQLALLDWRPDVLPRFGADGEYGSETAGAVRQFKVDELGVPAGDVIPDVGPLTVMRLDEMQLAEENPVPSGRVRQDIQTLMSSGAAGQSVIDRYAEGIRRMRALDPADGSDPTDARSWRFQAGIHGFPGLAPSLTNASLWGSCRHFSWFFLVWHRLYLFRFESIIQRLLEDDSWSLPYWDYTKTDDAAAKTLPEPFRVPADEQANPLFTPVRDPGINSATQPVAMRQVDTDPRGALVLPIFSAVPAFAGATFGGGEVTDTQPNHGDSGPLENSPHGSVHVTVGGLMGAFSTAALDPIFWLHHCNIDRLLDVWLGLHGTTRLPGDDTWLDTEFEFFDADGAQAAGPSIRDVLDSSALGYTYENIQPPAGTPPIPPPPPGPGAFGEEDAVVGDPELRGATPDVDLSGRADVPVEIAAPPPGAFGDDAGAHRWYLRVEDLTGTEPGAPTYDVYVNLPEGADPSAHPQHMVGVVSSFGIPEVTEESGTTGKTIAFDITELMTLLGSALSESGLTVTFVPTDATGKPVHGGDVRAGRISVYSG